MERLKSVLFIVVLAIFGLAFAPPPVMANIGPTNNICPNNTADDYPWADDTPWGELTSGEQHDAWVGPQYMVMNVANWLLDAGLIETSGDSEAQSTESGNRERNTADGLSQY